MSTVRHITVPADASVYALNLVDRWYLFHRYGAATAGVYSIAVAPWAFFMRRRKIDSISISKNPNRALRARSGLASSNAAGRPLRRSLDQW